MSGLAQESAPESVGTIGAGNMAEAILRGLLEGGMPPHSLYAADPVPERRALLERELGMRTTSDNAEVVRQCDVVVLAIKPQQLDAALSDLPRDARPLYLSIVAGCPLARLRRLLGPDARVVRSMPNTPALVQAGVSAIAVEDGAAPADLAWATRVLEAVGRVVRLPEPLLDAVTGLSGSGPAYVFAMIEALVDAGVAEGIPPEAAHELVVHTVLGAARLVHESGESPASLREKVSSPGGTTLAGLAALDERGHAAALAAAVRAATRRSRELAGGS